MAGRGTAEDMGNTHCSACPGHGCSMTRATLCGLVSSSHAWSQLPSGSRAPGPHVALRTGSPCPHPQSAPPRASLSEWMPHGPGEQCRRLLPRLGGRTCVSSPLCAQARPRLRMVHRGPSACAKERGSSHPCSWGVCPAASERGVLCRGWVSAGGCRRAW